VLLTGFCPVCYLLAYCACQLAHLAVFNSSFGLRVPASLNCMQNMKIMSVNLVKPFDNQHGVPSVTFYVPSVTLIVPKWSTVNKFYRYCFVPISDLKEKQKQYDDYSSMSVIMLLNVLFG